MASSVHSMRRRSALDDSQRDKLRDPPGETRLLDYGHDALDVFVREWRLLGEASVRRTPHDDPLRLEPTAARRQ